MADLTEELEAVFQDFPGLRQYGVQARRAPSRGGPGRIEFFPPDEAHNPMPGTPLIEVYDEDLFGDELRRVLASEHMHYLPRVDPKFNELRELLKTTMTPQQREESRRRYNFYTNQGIENRPYDRWFDISDFDQFLGGYISPPDNNEWEGAYTDKQRFIMEAMKDLMRGGKNYGPR